MTTTSDSRWIVERPSGGLEDVGADRMLIAQSGTLVFQDADEQLLIAYAPHTWVTVVPEAS